MNFNRENLPWTIYKILIPFLLIFNLRKWMNFNFLILFSIAFLAVLIIAKSDIEAIKIFASTITHLIAGIFGYLRGKNDE
jgi:hypothetical protein